MPEDNNKIILGDIIDKLSSREDIWQKRKISISSPMDSFQNRLLIERFYVSPLRGLYNLSLLNSFMIGLISGIEKYKIEEAKFERWVENPTKIEYLIKFGNITYRDYPYKEEFEGRRIITIRDESLLGDQQGQINEQLTLFRRGFERSEGRSDLTKINSENKLPIEIPREIKIFVYPNKKIAEAAFGDDLSPASFILMRNLRKYL